MKHSSGGVLDQGRSVC